MRVEVYVAKDCHYCEKTKALLDRFCIEFSSYDVGEDSRRAELVRRAPTARTLPQIFIDGKHIGSYEDLLAASESGIFNQPG